MSKRVYLDYNATSPLYPEVIEAMTAALAEFGNPSSIHYEGRKAQAYLEKSREQVAALVNAKADRVVFTSGSTEAACALLTPHWQQGRTNLFFSKLYVGATEHPCVLNGGRFAKNDIEILPVDSNGLIDQSYLANCLAQHDKTKGLPLVAIQAANHETGVIQDSVALCKIVKSNGGVFIVDATQGVGRFLIDFNEDFADFIFCSGHKISAPKGIGAWISSGDLLAPLPLLTGGGQEKGHRCGTQAMPLIVGFGVAAERTKQDLINGRCNRDFRPIWEKALKEIHPSIVIHGSEVDRIFNTSFFTIPGRLAETLQIAFDLKGVAVSAGSACSSGKIGISHVLKAMGVTQDEGAIRVSCGFGTTSEEVDAFIDCFTKIVTPA